LIVDIAVALMREADFAQIAQHARMDRLLARCGCKGVGSRGFARLRQALAFLRWRYYT